MKSLLRSPRWLAAVAVGVMVLVPIASPAYPPAPNHTLYGLVRDEYGRPLTGFNAQILFEPTNGVPITGRVVPDLEPGVNYRISLPMDSGTAPDLYKSTALKPTVPFRIQVRIGSTIYLPIEMAGTCVNLGKPAESTRVDLTLGVDANHDGLPDAWQQLLAAMLPGADVSPNGDPDGDGVANQQEYYLGTLPWVPDHGVRLGILARTGATPLLEFTVTMPYTYTILGSTNLQAWAPLPFKIPANGPADPARANYTATETLQVLQVEPQIPPSAPSSQYFFRIQVQ